MNFNPRKSFTAAGHEKSPVFEPGIYASICGTRLLAPTWANRAILHGAFFGCPDTVQAPLPWKCKCIITWKGAESREKCSIFSRVYLKTVNMPKQRVISHSAAPFSLEIQQVFLRKKPCTLEKSLAVSHIPSFRIDPKECGLLFSYHCSAAGKSGP